MTTTIKSRTGEKRPNRYPLVLPMLRILRSDACEEFRFHPTRKWRADFAIPSAKILIEIDGGIWMQGRHNRPAGFEADQIKRNAAAALGYLCLHFLPKHVASGYFIETVRGAIAAQEGKS